MKTQLFSDSQFDQMAEEVVGVLGTVGYSVGHQKVKEMALKAGCKESAAGRVLFSKRQIDELREELLRQYPRTPAKPGADEPSLIHPVRELRAGFGNLTPKYFDYVNDAPEGGNLARLIELIKFAQTEPRLVYITLPLSRQDVPPAIQELDSLVIMAKLTDKQIGSIDCTLPESVPFMAEMGEALGYKPADFVGTCNCINPPLRLEDRTAETMLIRARYHSQSMITPMPSLGGSGPADIYGTIILGTAEIVGGLILSMIIDPEAPLLGYISSNQVDMLTGNGTQCTPQVIRVDAGVHQLMEHAFGGGTQIGGRSYVNARRPGMQAVFERFLKAVGYAALVDQHALRYQGNGCLDNGSMISAEQFLLDLEILGGLDWLWTAPSTPPPGDAATRIQDVVMNGGGNFLETEHTLAHFRDEMWPASYFDCRTNTRSEKEILDRCHADYCEKVEHYQPASRPDDAIKELERILKRAKQQLSIA
jgi:trimethylamine:corrinoid methyltransferase-like protein